jgi:ribulose-phosphate 3-epimerase
MKKSIIPAIIAHSPRELYEMINSVKPYAALIQLDIMDGVFVKNRSIDFDFVLNEGRTLFEAHLMVSEPEQWIERIANRAETILVHYESCREPSRVIGLIRKKECKAGLAINPETPLIAIRDYLADIDQVLIMTVDPGFYGSLFVPDTAQKVQELRSLVPTMDIEVDGGINPETIGIMDRAGANKFVSGTYIMKSNNIKNAVRQLQDRIKNRNHRALKEDSS